MVINGVGQLFITQRSFTRSANFQYIIKHFYGENFSNIREAYLVYISQDCWGWVEVVFGFGFGVGFSGVNLGRKFLPIEI